jgi:hypothetical protein
MSLFWSRDRAWRWWYNSCTTKIRYRVQHLTEPSFLCNNVNCCDIIHKNFDLWVSYFWSYKAQLGSDNVESTESIQHKVAEYFLYFFFSRKKKKYRKYSATLCWCCMWVSCGNKFKMTVSRVQVLLGYLETTPTNFQCWNYFKNWYTFRSYRLDNSITILHLLLIAGWFHAIPWIIPLL